MDKIIEKLRLSNDIVLLVHESPDGDAIGSIIALYRALKKMGKNVEAFIEKIPSNCEFLISSIGEEIKVFEDMDENRKYDLCIALDCGDADRMGKAKVLFENTVSTQSYTYSDVYKIINEGCRFELKYEVDMNTHEDE